MNDFVAIGFAVLLTLIAFLLGTVLRLKEKANDCDFHLNTIRFLNDKLAQRDIDGERNFKELVGGIDGVTSVSLTSKRYVELLKAENDLAELKEKVLELGNE
jgi:hypothetical protein|nr:MAG TPA: GRB2-binding adapter (GAPT) [Caudoviricetes sp.]